MRPLQLLAFLATSTVLAGCGGGTKLLSGAPAVGLQAKTPQAAQKLGFPSIATKNTTRVGGGDPIADAAAVALAVYPSSGAGTHPQVVTIAPSDDWRAALASAVLMAPPLRAPILLSSSKGLPSASADALSALAPSGAGAAGGAQVIRIGNVATPGGVRAATISASGPFAMAAAIDRFVGAASAKASANVVIASADDPAYAMPAAAWAAESGEPVLFVTGSGVPEATRRALLSRPRAHIYVLGPKSVIPDRVLRQLRRYGAVKRVSGSDPASNSVAFAEYRDPPCVSQQSCLHIPNSFGWAMRSPGHGYVLVNSHRPLDAAAAAPLSSSGSYGPMLLVDDAATLPPPVLRYFLNYAVPGYSQYGPTQAFYDHAWVIGDPGAVSVAVQAQVDSVLEIEPVKAR